MNTKLGTLEMMALPGFWATFWFIPRLLGFSMETAFVGMFIGTIIWGWLHYQGQQESDAEKAEYYHMLSQQRQEMTEAQQTVAHVQAGKMQPPWSQ